MSVLKLIPGTDPLLKAVSVPFDFERPPIDPAILAENMAETMDANNGLGLAAPQVGIGLRVFVLKVAGAEGPQAMLCFNPRIVDTGMETEKEQEGCLSFPGLFVAVERKRKVRVRFQDKTGETHTKIFEGIGARAFQHELDHLDGVLFFTKVSRFERDRAFRKQKSFLRRNRKG